MLQEACLPQVALLLHQPQALPLLQPLALQQLHLLQVLPEPPESLAPLVQVLPLEDYLVCSLVWELQEQEQEEWEEWAE